MTSNRRILGAAAFSLALAGGGVAGALLGTPSLSLAQHEAESTAAAGEDGGPRRFDHRQEALAVAAEALGISEDDLKAALKDGRSIAEVADEQGVDVQTVIDALVAKATARLDALEASLPERMTELVNHKRGDHEAGDRGPRHAIRKGFEAAAEAIGITPQELKAALKEDMSVAEVAEANGVEAQTVIDAVVADASSRIDEAVAAGKLDEARAEEMKANLTERVTAWVNGERPERLDRPDGSDDEVDEPA